jgi:hypothetical protein
MLLYYCIVISTYLIRDFTLSLSRCYGGVLAYAGNTVYVSFLTHVSYLILSLFEYLCEFEVELENIKTRFHMGSIREKKPVVEFLALLDL